MQEYEEENLDKILDDFEQEQLVEASTPRGKSAKRKTAASSSRSHKKRQVVHEDDDDHIELETTRSGNFIWQLFFFCFLGSFGNIFLLFGFIWQRFFAFWVHLADVFKLYSKGLNTKPKFWRP